jgi:uncharacterized membrane protein
MIEFLKEPGPQLVIWAAALAILVAVAWFVIARVRDERSDNEPESSALLTEFREMHSRGEISDTEFGTIKSSLAGRLQEELNDSDKGD